MVKSNSIRSARGFTLIEVSIVLVVIGLVIGGITIGYSLVKTSELRQITANIQKLQAALNTFNTKYGCLPGDCPNATSFGLGGVNGNGDGQINTSLATSGESMYAWVHLANAGLIEGAYNPAAAVYMPDSKYAFRPAGAGFYNLFSLNGVNYLEMTASTIKAPIAAWGCCQGGGAFTTYEAEWIDAKIDDGLPGSTHPCDKDYVCGSGNYYTDVSGVNQWQGKLVKSNWGATSCVDDTAAVWQYYVQNTSPTYASWGVGPVPPCFLVIKLGL